MATVTSFIDTERPIVSIDIDPERYCWGWGSKRVITKFKKDKDGQTRGYIAIFCTTINEANGFYIEGLKELKQKIKTHHINYDWE